MIKVTINNICAKLVKCEPLLSGMIGKLVEVSFSAEWSELNKIAVFSNGDVTKDLYESQWNGNYIPIPQEVLATPHRTISMGIYGYALVDGEKVLAIPTIVAEIGKTKFGTDPSNDPAADPTLPIWAQLQWEIDHFEVDEQQIAEQVQAYLAEHPIEIPKASASVLGGIKVGANLSITADGTLSAEGGGYEPPVGGIPKTDLASDVQASLGKADTALQSADTVESEEVELADVAISGNYNDLTNKPIIPTVPANVSAFTNDSGYLTQHQSLAAYRTASAQDAIDSGFVKLVGAAGQTIQTNVAVPLNVKNNIVLQHRAFVGFQTHDDNAIGFIGVDSGKPTFLAADGVTAKALQSETITDTAGYFTTDTVEDALAEIGGTLDGLESAINTIRGVS